MTLHKHLGKFGPEDNLDISEIIGADLNARESRKQQEQAGTIGHLLADQDVSVQLVNPVTAE